MNSERRGANRVFVSIPGEFVVLRESRECELRNLSASGVLLRAPAHSVADPWVHIRFTVPEVDEPISMDGVVVRKRRAGLESEWAIHLNRSNDARNQIYDDFVARTLAGETEAGRSPNRPLRLRTDDPPSLKRLYRRALKNLDGNS